MSSRVDQNTEKFVMKEVHGQLVKVRILKPFMGDEDEITASPKLPNKKVKKKYCTFCEVEVFDPGKECDLCGREF